MRHALLTIASLALIACGDPTGLDELTPEVRAIFERMAAQEFETLSAEIHVSQRAESADGSTVQPMGEMTVFLDLGREGRFRCEARRGDELWGDLVNDGALQRHRTLRERDVFLLPGVPRWGDADRATLESVTERECTLLIALFGWVPPYEEILALPTPPGEQAVTIIEGAEEIDGHPCDAVELRSLLHGQRCVTRYLVEDESGMLRRMEFIAADSGGNLTMAVEEFRRLEIGAAFTAGTFDPTPPHGVSPHGALFDEGEGEPIDLREDLAPAVTAPFGGTVHLRRWSRNGPREEITVGIDLASPGEATLVASSEPWVQPSRLTLTDTNLSIESQFQPRTSASPATWSEIPCEAMIDLGLPQANLVMALLGLDCEPLASLLANATSARLLGETTRDGRELQILTARSRYATGGEVTLLIGADPETGLPFTFEIYERQDPTKFKRMSVEWLEGR